jgi:hypothetical protein
MLKTSEVNKNVWKGLQLPLAMSLCALVVNRLHKKYNIYSFMDKD